MYILFSKFVIRDLSMVKYIQINSNKTRRVTVKGGTSLALIAVFSLKKFLSSWLWWHRILGETQFWHKVRKIEFVFLIFWIRILVLHLVKQHLQISSHLVTATLQIFPVHLTTKSGKNNINFFLHIYVYLYMQYLFQRLFYVLGVLIELHRGNMITKQR